MTKHLTHLAMAVFKSIGRTMAQRGTSAWLFVALIVALALAIGGWRLGSVVVPVALDAEARLTDFRQLSTGQLVAHRSPALDDLYQSVSEAESDIRLASRTTRWVSRFSPRLFLATRGPARDGYMGQPGAPRPARPPRCIRTLGFILSTP